MPMGDNAAYLKAREFSRVDAFIPMEACLLPPEARDGVRSQVSRQTFLIHQGVPEEVEDRVLSDWLRMLNAKLDVIIQALRGEKGDFAALPFRQVNISAGGMKFSSRTGYERGNVLEIKMVLQMQRPAALRIYGEVVTSEKKGSDFDVAVKFILVDEDVRDELVRYVFERQREILRGKRT